jgi:hypothetical protein
MKEVKFQQNILYILELLMRRTWLAGWLAEANLDHIISLCKLNLYFPMKWNVNIIQILKIVKYFTLLNSGRALFCYSTLFQFALDFIFEGALSIEHSQTEMENFNGYGSSTRWWNKFEEGPRN